MARNLIKTVLYQGFRSLLGVVAIGYFRCRWHNGYHVPDRGPALLVANHQSHLDPILVGVGCHRRLSFLARKTLFVGPFGRLIPFLDAIPVDQERSGASGVKETLRRLKRGEAVVIFPEGTRSPDGHLGPLRPGFCGLAKRSRATIVPIGIAGAFEAWPRSTRFPRPGRVVVQFGKPIAPAVVAAMDDSALTELIARQIGEYQAVAESFR